MKKLIQVLIVCGLFVVIGGTASGETQEEIIAEMCSKDSYPIEKNMIKVKGFYLGMSICDANKIITKGKYKNLFKNPIYLVLSDKEKIDKAHAIRQAILICAKPYDPTPSSDEHSEVRTGLHSVPEWMANLDGGNVDFTCGSKTDNMLVHGIALQLYADKDGRVLKINFGNDLTSDLFKSRGLTYEQFLELFRKAYIKSPASGTWESSTKYKQNTYYDSTLGFKVIIAKKNYINEDGTTYFDLAGSIHITREVKASEGFGD